MMHCDVRFHLAFVYEGLNSASFSVVLVFEAELSHSKNELQHFNAIKRSEKCNISMLKLQT